MNDIAGKDKVGLYELFVELVHADFKGRLSLGILGNHLLNCAGLHAAARGFGMSRINEINYTWVLSRLVIEMNRFPLKNERFYISTWVEDVYRLFTNRNYTVYDADRNVMGYVRSVWAMIDMDSRKPVDLISLYGDKLTSYICKDEPCPIEGPTRFRLKEQVEPECVCMPKYSDIDINGHFNSIKYIEHILDLFPVEFHDRHEVRRFEIAYQSEGRSGDELYFYRHPCAASGDEYAVEVKKNGAELLCRALVKFAGD